MSRYANFTPGLASTPKKKSNGYDPDGVRPSPSCFVSGGANPLAPMFAGQGPNTCVHPSPSRSNAVKVAVVCP